MKGRNIYSLVLILLAGSACLPLPGPRPSATPTQDGTLLPPTRTETLTPTGTEPSTLTPAASPAPLTIPAQEDWEAEKPAVTHGAEGEWDSILWGGFAHSLVKKGDTYFLYYQGSSHYDEECESVAFRYIGVATSSDGITWTKYAGNPVLTWSRQGSVEEGATSSAAWLGEDGRIYLYYGANTGSGCHVNTSARLAVSDDGLEFLDVGEVLSGSDPDVWGSGDEIFPIGVFADGAQWTLYYTPNGVPLSRKLGAALGLAPNHLTQSLGVNDDTVSAWGPISAIDGGAQSVLVVNPDTGPQGELHWYRFEASHPAQIEMRSSYTLPNCNQASVLYEEDVRRWMMSCLDQNYESYNIRFAPMP